MTTVALMANSLHYPEGGGHRWVYLNWALGFRSIGCDVLWVEWADPRRLRGDFGKHIAALEAHLKPYGLADRVALLGGPLADTPAGVGSASMDGESLAAHADVLVNFVYELPANLIRHYMPSELVAIDLRLIPQWYVRWSMA